MPVFNAMPYLPEAMESLLSQSFPHFEILAILDGATDGSADYLRSIRDPRLRILERPRQGLTATLNQLLHEAHTPWLVRQDADDVSYPDRMKRIIAAIADHPEAGMFYSFAHYHPRQRCTGRFRTSAGAPRDLRRIVSSGYLLSICHPTAVLNVQKTLALGGYRMDLHVEDADLWWRMALRHDIHCIAEPLVGFRQHPASTSAGRLDHQHVAGLYVQYLLLSCLWKLTPLPWDQVRPHLSSLCKQSSLLSKWHLRTFNISLSDRRYSQAAAHLWRSFAASPGYLLSRLRDELSQSRTIRNGLAPDLFRARRELLWR